MTDIAITKTGNYYDISIGANGDFSTDDGYDTQIKMAILGYKKANQDEVVDPLLRRGWIGNVFFDEFENGSKVWLYEQSRLNNSTVNSIKFEVEKSLQYFIDDGKADNIEVTAISTIDAISVSVNFYVGTNSINIENINVWEATGVS